MTYNVNCPRDYGLITFKANNRCPVSNAVCCEQESCNMENAPKKAGESGVKKKKKK